MPEDPTTPPPEGGDHPAKPPEKPPEQPKPPETPKYEPPDDVHKSVEYYKRDVGKGGEKLQGLLNGLHEAGIEVVPGTPAPDPETATRVDKMERELAKRDAALEFGLTIEDVRILDGTPDEIKAKAKYLSERLGKDKPGETPPSDDKPGETKPPEGETKPAAPTFQTYTMRSDDPQEAIKKAEAAMNESIAAGGKFGEGGAG